MKDIIVVCYATHRAGLMDEYEQQLKDADIPLHVETVSLPDGINSVTARWKFEYMRRMCEKFADYDRIVFTDAWDVLFYGNQAALLEKIPPLLMSAERNCWPDPDAAVWIKSPSPWKFANPGMIAGYPEFLENLLNQIEWEVPESALDEMEQKTCNHMLGTHPTYIHLDTRTTLFYVVSADKEDGSLTIRIRDGALFNDRYWTTPHFVHFSGKCPTEPFRAMLRGEVDAL